MRNIPPLYHWSPSENRESILEYGLRPSTPHRNGTLTVCLATDPYSAWALTDTSLTSEWDLYQVRVADTPVFKVKHWGEWVEYRIPRVVGPLGVIWLAATSPRSSAHGPVLTWRNHDGPEHIGGTCKCGKRKCPVLTPATTRDVGAEWPTEPNPLAKSVVMRRRDGSLFAIDVNTGATDATPWEVWVRDYEFVGFLNTRQLATPPLNLRAASTIASEAKGGGK